jgi:GntR family transcriptional regulator
VATLPPNPKVVPKYYWVEERLRRRILHLEPGTPLSSEPDLAREFGVSRTTMRTAIGMLVSQGLLRRLQGKGTFVAPRETFPLGYDQEPPAEPHLHKVLSVETSPAGPGQARQFGCPEDAAILTVVRVGIVGGIPMSICTMVTPLTGVPGILEADYGEDRFFCILRDLGVDLERYRLFIESVILADTEARLLDVRQGLPGIRLIRHGLSGDGRLMADVTILFRGDAGRFYLEDGHMEHAIPCADTS